VAARKSKVSLAGIDAIVVHGPSAASAQITMKGNNINIVAKPIAKL
jgi:hypothetical protein